MIDHQIDEEMILRDEVSDEALEAIALVALGGFPTLPHTYCFACPATDPQRSYSGVLFPSAPGRLILPLVLEVPRFHLLID